MVLSQASSKQIITSIFFCIFTNYIVWDYSGQDWFMNSCSLLWGWCGPGTDCQRICRCPIPGSSKSGWMGFWATCSSGVFLPMAGALEQDHLLGPFQPKLCYDSVIISSMHLEFKLWILLFGLWIQKYFSCVSKLSHVSTCNWEFRTVFFAALPKYIF